ncbi:MAG: ATP-binding protein [Methanobrevibacter sp.]|jgi:hypothetical protein|nr:ATP-binding protein [Methanobrevibacter sp.]
MNNLKNLPLAIAEFKELIETDSIYVDKTEEIFKLMEEAGNYFFLSRPRRFGKSLLLNTIKELFRGNKELFKGLYIYNKWNWNENFPIIYLNMSKMSNRSPEKLELDLEDFIETIAEENQITINNNISLERKFSHLIRKLSKSTGKKVVVLIDEYDKPILDKIDEMKIADANREILKSFYEILKGSEEYLHFVFLTGVSKFSQTSIFSGFNNATDLTLDPKFNNICGYTHHELRTHFKDYITLLAKKEFLSYNEVLNRIDYWYDGYSWDGINKVYNPFSTLSLFRFLEFKNKWFESGTPTFLVKLLKIRNDFKPILEPIKAFESSLSTFDLDNININTLLFQTGYLTIKSIEKAYEEICYTLDFPNFEVENSFLNYLLNSYTNYQDDIKSLRYTLLKQIKNIDNGGFNSSLNSLLYNIPYQIHKTNESYFHAIFIILFKLLGFNVRAEESTISGRSDLVLEEDNFVVIAEFKYSTTKTSKNGDEIPIKSFKSMLNEAFNQIHDRGYYKKYTNTKIILIAIAFAGKDIESKMELLNLDGG